MIYRLRTLITKEILQFVRDRVLFTFALLGPALQIMLLGRAIGQDIANMPVAVVDYDLSPLSRQIITALDNTRELVVAAVQRAKAEQKAEAREAAARTPAPAGAAPQPAPPIIAATRPPTPQARGECDVSSAERISVQLKDCIDAFNDASARSRPTRPASNPR